MNERVMKYTRILRKITLFVAFEAMGWRECMKKAILALLIAAPLVLTGLVRAQTTQTQPTQAQPTSAEQYYANAQQLAAQAEIAYPQPFLDLPLWDSAVSNAQAAADLAPTDFKYLRYAAELYTTTQWWIRAYDTWKMYESKTALDDAAKTLAAKSAAKLGYLSMQRGAKADAVTYLEASLKWKEDPSTRALLERAKR
jgi:hypothetical protein